MANLMWAVVKLGANPLDGALLQACTRELLPRSACLLLSMFSHLSSRLLPGLDARPDWVPCR